MMAARGRRTTSAVAYTSAGHDEARVKAGFWLKVRRFAASLPFAEDALAAYYCAFDRETPNSVRVTLLGALAYFVLPTDVMPDILPLIGFADDAGVLATAIMTVGSNIRPQHREAARDALAQIEEPAQRAG